MNVIKFCTSRQIARISRLFSVALRHERIRINHRLSKIQCGIRTVMSVRGCLQCFRVFDWSFKTVSTAPRKHKNKWRIGIKLARFLARTRLALFFFYSLLTPPEIPVGEKRAKSFVRAASPSLSSVKRIYWAFLSSQHTPASRIRTSRLSTIFLDYFACSRNAGFLPVSGQPGSHVRRLVALVTSSADSKLLRYEEAATKENRASIFSPLSSPSKQSFFRVLKKTTWYLRKLAIFNNPLSR